MNIDTILFQAINGLAGISPAVDYIGIFLARYLAYVLVGILAVMAVRSVRNWNILLEAAFAAFLARFGIVTLIRILVHRARPFVDATFQELITIDPGEFYGSFPSGHAAFFFALATVIWFHNRRLGIYFFGASLLMGIGRIFAGVHWPSDIAGGAAVGILTAMAVHRFYVWFSVRYSKIS